VRFQLELLKPEMLLDEAKIGSTLVIYGSARNPFARTGGRHGAPPRPRPNARPWPSGWREVAGITRKRASWRTSPRPARSSSRACASSWSARAAGRRSWKRPIAARSRPGAETIGLNIVLPHEQAPNTYVTPRLSFQFHYFALRKMHFLLRARAVAVFPGGFGTFDEFFELLTLIQTGKMKPIPILLFGKEYWNRVINFEGAGRRRRDQSLDDLSEQAVPLGGDRRGRLGQG
jgi:predicted Rossmann-fold nucleotide-binding protein